MNKAIQDIIAGFKLYPVWLHQAYYFLSAKYKRTVLGSLWIAGNFVFYSLAIALIFGDLFNHSLKSFLPYVMLGTLGANLSLWVLHDAPELYMSSASIIRNHANPFTYFTYEEVARVTMLFLHNLVVFYIFMIFNGTLVIPHWTIIFGLPLVLLIMAFWGSLVGLAAARYRDLRFLLNSMSTMLFFLTPIYWHIEQLGPKHRWIAEFNPLYTMVTLIRDPLMGRAPANEFWSIALGLALSGFALWFAAFSAFRRRIPFWV